MVVEKGWREGTERPPACRPVQRAGDIRELPPCPSSLLIGGKMPPCPGSAACRAAMASRYERRGRNSLSLTDKGESEPRRGKGQS